MAQASSIPCLPVTAFAQPLLTTNLLALPSFLSRTCWQTRTGAALNAFRVYEAAAEVWRAEVDNMTARSKAEVFLTPQCTPVTAYPFGNTSSESRAWRWAFE